MVSGDINFNHGGHDKILENDYSFSTSEEYSDIESSTKSSPNSFFMEEDIKTHNEQLGVELFHSTSGLDFQGPYMIHTATFEEVQAYMYQCLKNGFWNMGLHRFR